MIEAGEQAVKDPQALLEQVEASTLGEPLKLKVLRERATQRIYSRDAPWQADFQANSGGYKGRSPLDLAPGEELTADEQVGARGKQTARAPRALTTRRAHSTR